MVLYNEYYLLNLINENGDGLPNKTQIMITEKKYLKSLEIVNTYLEEQEKLKFNSSPLYPIIESDISVRLYNCLKQNGIVYLNELCGMELHEFMRFRNFGRQTLHHLEWVMED